MPKTYLEPADVEKLEAAATFVRDKLLIRLLFHLGCRVSEVISLGPGDVDLKNGTITIVHLKTRLRLLCPKCQTRLARYHRFCPGCAAPIEGPLKSEQETRRQRTLPVDRDTLRMLRNFIKRGGPVRRGDKELLLGIKRHRAWQIVVECAEKASLGTLTNPETGKRHRVSPHRLRDAFATHAAHLDSSADGLRLLQEHLGHASFNTTARYRKVSGREQKQWFNMLWEKKDASDGAGTTTD